MVLVTGGSGLVGKELLTQLITQGKPIKALYNKTPLPNFNSNLVQQIQCNILDIVGLEEAMQGVEQVYHCAAIVSFNPKQKQQMFKINIEGTANVVNAALNAGVKKMVHVSSVAALGRIREDKPIDETMNWTPETSNSAYGQSKYLAEMEVWRGIAEGLNAAIVNPVIILGNGNWEDGSTKIFKSVYEEFPWYTTGSTGFVDVKDVAKAMIALMQSTITAQRFIVSAQNKTYQQVFNVIANAFGKKQPSKLVTPLIAALAWRVEAIKSWFTKKEPLLTKETTKTALAKVTFDNSKLLKHLPNFTYNNLEDTIERVCKELKNQSAASA
ncbi:MAG: NAD-dependent epimerase/dehydratase family protein [Ferruginibacter sp.]|nr:NAD-dependent epimerase/dehydratase family protein [Ferruginibacter sp.]